MQLLDKFEGGENLPRHSFSLLSIDLGETTGVAYFDLRTNKLMYGYTKNNMDINQLVGLVSPTLILLEKFPQRTTLAVDVSFAYYSLIEKSILIAPGTWKPFMKSRKRDFPGAETQHEKDAISMLRYYMITQLTEDIP